MEYISTRDKDCRVPAARAIVQGISHEGGLFVPQALPAVSLEWVEKLASMSYAQRAKEVLSLFLTDFEEEELSACVTAAYGENFDDDHIAPLVRLGENRYLLELWHGPTSAFKDMALQLLPHLMRASAAKLTPPGEKEKEVVILVATSGDTGKAALEGFRDVDHTRMIVFYPQNGVSPMQKLQMATQEGENVCVCAIRGNFDDAQTGVKNIFTGPMEELLERHNMICSSANSINWGRLVPQIVYYFSAYCDLLSAGEIALGDPVNAVVPTGNFGNILAAYYAKRMGLPLAKLICASNRNNVLTDFFSTGCYDRNREFHLTLSPSMDILVSSNLERLLFHLYDGDDRAVAALMAGLKTAGSYRVEREVLEKARRIFDAGCCGDAETRETIRRVVETYGYLCDPHTAVAVRVHEDYVARTGDDTKAIIDSTASPYKFPASVLSAVTGQEAAPGEDEFAAMERLHQLTRFPVPENLSNLRQKPVRFTQSCGKEEMESFVRRALGL